MEPRAQDGIWMRRAIGLARRGIGLTSPNPPVGAVLVREGEVLGEGFHRRAGEAHAEIEAIRDARGRGVDDLSGSTIYVTLEPCSTAGRTGACTEAIAKAGIARVVYGATDPNPDHSGKANEQLRKEQIEVVHGILEEECEELLRAFRKLALTGRPYVIAKAGMTLDGRITRPAGEGRWITSEEARADAMGLRVRSDAILVGAGTVRADNPSLTLRGQGIPEGKVQPLRVILTRGSGENLVSYDVFNDLQKNSTVFLGGDRDLGGILDDLAGRGVMCVLVEGGGEVLRGFFNAGLVDEVVFYVAPRIGLEGVSVTGVGEATGSVDLRFGKVERVGDDLKVVAYPR